MNSILRIDQRLALYEFPSPVTVGGGCPPIGPGDTLILCAGFEPRSVEILKRVRDEGLAELNIVWVEYRPKMHENLTPQVEAFLQDSNWNVTSVMHDRANPSYSGEKVLDQVSRDPESRLWIDISGMSRLLILQLISGLSHSCFGFRNTHVLYASPKVRHPGKEDFEAQFKEKEFDATKALLFMSTGVQDVTVVPELSSFAMQGEPVRLLIFPSFNSHQFTSVMSAVQPAHVDLVFGKSRDPEQQWRVEAIKRVNGLEKNGGYSSIFTSSIDYGETVKFILNWYNQFSAREKLVICPTGSKLQALAVAILRSFLYDLHIVYPTPRQFAKPSLYTEGVREILSVDLSYLPKRNSLKVGSESPE